MFNFLIAAAEVAPENKFGFMQAMEEGGPVAWSILAVMVIMSVGSFYILFSKLFEQNKVMGQYRKGRAAFWKSSGLKDGALKFEKNSAWRQLDDDAVKAVEGVCDDARFIRDLSQRLERLKPGFDPEREAPRPGAQAKTHRAGDLADEHGGREETAAV